MFKSAVVKLTLMYLGILIVISGFFSWNLYRVSIREVERGLRPPQGVERTARFRALLNDPDLADVREELIESAKQRVLLQLLYANIGVLVLGGAGSYFLARRTLRPIERAHEAQNRFTSDASHELRTPLATMQAEIEVALRNHDLDLVRAKGLLKSNLEEVERLTSLTEGLLRLANNPEKTMHRVPCRLSDVIRDAVQQHAGAAEKKNIQITTQLTHSDQILGDPDQLERVFGVLLDNAVRYSSSGVKINIESTHNRDELRVRVSDTGSGIEPEHLAHIFDRFYRVDQSRNKEDGAGQSGYGLGLAIAKQIVKAHRGDITVDSAKGKGTIFTVTLPAAKA